MSAPEVCVAINAWFADQPGTGSGQYTTRLLRHLSAVAPSGKFLPVRPGARSPYGILGEDLYKVWFEQVEFPGLARQQGAHVVHVPYWAAPLRARRPVVVTIHDLIPVLLPEYRGGWKGQRYARLVTASAKRADLILTDSEASKRDIVSTLGISANRVRVIYLAADEEYAPQSTDAIEELRARLALPETYVLYFGGFDVRKNLDGVMRAFARLVAHEPDAALVIAGRLPFNDTSFTPDPHRLAREIGVGDHVSFVGWVDEKDKPALFAGAQAMIFPSVYEGFGLPALEAMACGTPVVASDAGSLPEIVGDGGFLHDPRDADAMGDSLLALWRHTGLRRELGRKAIKWAGRFSWRRTAESTWRAYRELAGEP